MKKKSIHISLEDEQMARHIALLVQKASKFESAIYIQSGDKKVNAKSIMGMMSMGLQSGDEVIITVNGEDEEVAMENIEKYLTGN